MSLCIGFARCEKKDAIPFLKHVHDNCYELQFDFNGIVEKGTQVFAEPVKPIMWEGGWNADPITNLFKVKNVGVLLRVSGRVHIILQPATNVDWIYTAHLYIDGVIHDRYQFMWVFEE